MNGSLLEPRQLLRCCIQTIMTSFLVRVSGYYSHALCSRRKTFAIVKFTLKQNKTKTALSVKSLDHTNTAYSDSGTTLFALSFRKLIIKHITSHITFEFIQFHLTIKKVTKISR